MEILVDFIIFILSAKPTESIRYLKSITKRVRLVRIKIEGLI